VLGAYVFVMEARSFLTSHGENFSYSLCEVVPVHLAILSAGASSFACNYYRTVRSDVARVITRYPLLCLVS
jgi:hypothetical protein